MLSIFHTFSPSFILILPSPLLAGQAQLSGVEWKHMGQEGFTAEQDPRFSLVFLGLGSRGASSYVRQCSFNTNYNTAVGIFASSGVAVEDCVVYQTVGSSTLLFIIIHIFCELLII